MLIIDKLGRKGDCAQYLHGIFFAALFAPKTAPDLKQLFMTDACHVHFGKYTLFSCYGVTANGNMSSVGFTIVFGNENGTTWKEFWEFVKGVHPLLNLPYVTIVTDQNKQGQKFAIKDVMDQSGHCHCLQHWRGNITKMCGSKSGSCIYSVLWVYNLLEGCQMVQATKREKNSSMEIMHIKDAQYLNHLEDAEQYPAVRSKKGPGIYMYHKSTSTAVESMNSANCKMCSK